MVRRRVLGGKCFVGVALDLCQKYLLFEMETKLRLYPGIPPGSPKHFSAWTSPEEIFSFMAQRRRTRHQDFAKALSVLLQRAAKFQNDCCMGFSGRLKPSWGHPLKSRGQASSSSKARVSIALSGRKQGWTHSYGFVLSEGLHRMKCIYNRNPRRYKIWL